MEQYFNLLECTSTTSLKEIEKKYKKLMRKTHPDRGNDDKLCKEINEAYQYILNYKLNNLIDISNTIIPITFRNIGFNHLQTPDIRKNIEPTTKINDNTISYNKQKLLSYKKEILKQKELCNNSNFLLEYLQNKEDNEDNEDNDNHFGDNDIESTFRKNLLTSKFIHAYEEKKDKGILENLFNYFFE